MDARTSFVVPAPPQLIIDRRRHSDAEAMKTASKSYQDAQTLADLIVKREKISVKRTTSDPGGVEVGPAASAAAHLLQYRADSFSLDNVDMYQEEQQQFAAPGLDDEVFPTNILQGQLSQLQPFQSESLDDCLEMKDDNLLDIKEMVDMKHDGDEDLQELSLDDIASLHDEPLGMAQAIPQVNQELQAVLNSPLPESLAEFSTYHTSRTLDMQSPSYSTQSPGKSPIVVTKLLN